ncbi:HK97 family phage portal protein [Sphingobium sp. B7D2B]|uniref:phage portal protein n=1 Tax=Sphingobium sp. B7D2B TaxID=2940583 RepID=UPI002224BE42|nr:phage portal protein [Sphingobium sp. B7D2B]MCW2365557.1 HK97 family phage portal protein [Sphingobium sp. B7D2B]
MVGFIDFILGRSGETKSARPYTDVLGEIAEAQAGSGLPSVDADRALKSTAVLCVVRVIADGIAQVPFKLLQENGSGGRGEPAKTHPLYDLIRYSPNDWQTSYEFREQLAIHLALCGNAFIYLNRHPLTKVVQELYAFEPGSVTVTQHDDYSLSYKVQTNDKKFLTISQDDMWHIRGPSWNGWMGLEATTLARQAIGLSLASETYGANLFANGARPGGILSSDANLTKEQREQLREAWQQQQGGTKNAHKTAILGNGVKWQALASSANDAQWTESRRFQIEEICRAFRVQPIMVMQQGATSYASVEQLMLAHIQNTLMPWYERIEQSARKALLTPMEKRQGYYFKLDSRALLEASTSDRVAYFNAMRAMGVMTINEVREKEDLPRSDDPLADKLMPAANLFGTQPTTEPEADSTNKQDNNNEQAA